MVPRPGPPRLTFTTRHGSSAQAMYDSPSCIRLIPGLDEEVIALAPAPAAPYTMLMAASSLYTCMTTITRSLASAVRYSRTSDCGVIG